jgi:hypothetical protein
MKPLWLALALAVSMPLAPALASAQGKGAVADDQEDTAMWVKRLDDAKADLDGSKEQLLSYLNAKGRGAARNYPRGPAKEVYLKGIADSEAAYEAARQHLPEVIDEARRAGIVPGVLDPYEQAASAAVPVADITDDAAAQANPGDDDVKQAEVGDSGVDDDVDAATNTDSPEDPAKNTDTQEEDPGPQTDDGDSN